MLTKNIFLLLLLTTIFSINANEAMKFDLKSKFSSNFETFSFKLSNENINFYKNEGNKINSTYKRTGIILTSVGGGVLGFFYLLTIIIDAASWGLRTDLTSSDYSLMGASIGLAFLPCFGILGTPALAYQATINDERPVIYSSSDEVTVAAATALSVLFSLFQLSGLGIMIPGIIFLAKSRQKVSLIIDSKSYGRNEKRFIIGMSVKL